MRRKLQSLICTRTSLLSSCMRSGHHVSLIIYCTVMTSEAGMQINVLRPREIISTTISYLISTFRANEQDNSLAICSHLPGYEHNCNQIWLLILSFLISTGMTDGESRVDKAWFLSHSCHGENTSEQMSKPYTTI